METSDATEDLSSKLASISAYNIPLAQANLTSLGRDIYSTSNGRNCKVTCQRAICLKTQNNNAVYHANILGKAIKISKGMINTKFRVVVVSVGKAGEKNGRSIHCNGLVVRWSGGLTRYDYNLHRYYSVHVKCCLIKTVGLNK